ncbi:hypothetical protein GpartN1_g3895.t1 [Galdieria partita]|uniref:Uncharacterized protein n=1 Tax=Galdieria partita TaxID=83374 RepID=A0A9C7PX10_9RHOD|nr:hypothetical protein GpartN1_g3895.t1 [Galdieria partita]
MTKSQSSQNENNSFTFQEPLVPSIQSETRQVERKDVFELHDGSVSFESDSNWVASTVSDEVQLSSRFPGSLSLHSHPSLFEDGPVHCDHPNSRDLPICTPFMKSDIHQSWKNDYVISDSVDFDFSHSQQMKAQQTEELSNTALLKQLLCNCLKMSKEKFERLHLTSFLLGALLSFGTARIPRKFWLLVVKCTGCLFLVYVLWFSHQKTRYHMIISWLLRKWIQLIPTRYVR